MRVYALLYVMLTLHTFPETTTHEEVQDGYENTA
jgi:hypothetical protein